mgnify:CR=1 FL=1
MPYRHYTGLNSEQVQSIRIKAEIFGREYPIKVVPGPTSVLITFPDEVTMKKWDEATGGKVALVRQSESR